MIGPRPSGAPEDRGEVQVKSVRRTSPPQGRPEASRARRWAPQALTVLSIWLAWQIVVGLLVQRAPVEAAVRVAPGSAQVLSRAAESELVAGRMEQAGDLARLALSAAPFDVRAMRVLGLSIAESDADAADEVMTLAGNWSLRDDPSHAWLFERRLRQGDYLGAFGHADVLIRRRPDLRPRMFELFTVAVAEDPRSHPALLQRVSVFPNWRRDYLEWLRTFDGGAPAQAVLAIGLNGASGRLTDEELETIYGDWARAGRIPGLLEMRRRLGRPPVSALHDGAFSDQPAPSPFRWIVGTGPGLAASISETDGGNSALFVETDGFNANQVATQLVQFEAGEHRLSVRARFEAGAEQSNLEWTLACAEGGSALFRLPTASSTETGTWLTLETRFRIPAQGCTAQWLTLLTRQGSRRGTTIVWFDDLRVTPFAEPS